MNSLSTHFSHLFVHTDPHFLALSILFPVLLSLFYLSRTSPFPPSSFSPISRLPLEWPPTHEDILILFLPLLISKQLVFFFPPLCKLFPPPNVCTVNYLLSSFSSSSVLLRCSLFYCATPTSVVEGESTPPSFIISVLHEYQSVFRTFCMSRYLSLCM